MLLLPGDDGGREKRRGEVSFLSYQEDDGGKEKTRERDCLPLWYVGEGFI